MSHSVFAYDEGFDGVARSARQLAPWRWVVALAYLALISRTLNPQVAAIWGGALALGEIVNWLATSPNRRGATPSLNARRGYLLSAVWVSCTWSGLGCAFWTSATPGGEYIALLIWSALLFNAASHAFRSPLALVSLGASSALSILIAPLLWPKFEGVFQLFVVLSVVVYVVYAVVSANRSVQAAAELRAARSELEAQTAAAQAANQAKSAFLAMMSHELRTPMNGVLGMAHALEGTNLDARQGRYVQTLLRSGGGLMTTLNDILDLAKIEAGKFDIVARPFDLRQAISRTGDLWSQAAQEKGLAFVCDLDPAVPHWTAGDDARLRQILQNLLSNAVKFTAKGEVRLTVSCAGEGLIDFIVSDTGLGIDEAALPALFQGFSQADSSIARRFAGTGLGLAISRELARLMGGDITVESRLGEGSRFTLRLPLAAVAAEESRSETATPGAADEIRVLVVDDNATNQEVARALLEAVGVTVATASSGTEALETLDACAFDVVLMDIHMPGMSGIETLAAIRATGRESLPVVALTADAMAGERERLLALGFDGYLSKPIEPAALVRALAA